MVMVIKIVSLLPFYLNFFFFVAGLIIPTLKEAHKLNATERYHPCLSLQKAKMYGTNSTKNIKGTFGVGSQYAYTMEPQTTVCVPAEEGIDVLVASQHLDFAQSAIADALGIPNNSINMLFRRLGGGFGVKASRSAQIACAAALGCHITHRAVRFVLSIETNITSVGGRSAFISDYEVDVDDNGKIQKLTHNYIQDLGSSRNDNIGFFTSLFMKSCYNAESWDANAQMVLTNAPGHTFCRAPGSTEAVAVAENLMEHIAHETGLDPIAVRLANIKDGHKMKELVPDFLNQIG